MQMSFAAGSAAEGSGRRAVRASWLVATLPLLVVCAVAARPAGAGKVQETGPPVRMQGCDRCTVQASFAEKIRSLGATIELVELKNGVGVLYATEDPRNVARVQKAAEWAKQELQAIAEDPGNYQLCSYCKATIAVFSKVDREVVRTGQGALFLMRSDDPEAVRALKTLMTKSQKKMEARPPAPSR
jgi:hypothetical protein